MSWRLALPIGLALLVLAFGGLSVALLEQQGRLEEQLRQAGAGLASERAAKDAAAKAATASYNQLQTACRADLVAAIKGGRTIERIVSAPAPAPGAPRGIVGAGELRDIVGEPGS